MEKQAPLKDVLSKIIRDIKKKEKEELDFEKAWDETVGAKAARHTKPACIKNKRLIVNVSNSTWLYKLTLEKNELINTLNEKAKQKKIKEIQFRIGDVKKKDM